MSFDPNASYEENYTRGPQARLHPGRAFPRIRYKGLPRHSFLGEPCYLPLGIPAGPLLHAGYVEMALNAGFCLPVYKTVRSRPWPSHPWPNVLAVSRRPESRGPFFDACESGGVMERVVARPLDARDFERPAATLSITNSFGVPSRAPQEWQADFSRLAPLERWPGQIPILSFQGSRPDDASQPSFLEDTAACARLAAVACAGAGTDILEVNLSCPNEGGMPVFRDPAAAVTALKAIRDVWKGKLIAKLGVLSDAEFALFLGEAGGLLDALSLINTISATIEDPHGAPALGLDRRSGGVCGALILEQALRAVERAARLRTRLGLHSLGIIGVGGVSGAACVRRHLDAGADAVMAATGAMWNLNLAAETASALGVSYETVS